MLRDGDRAAAFLAPFLQRGHLRTVPDVSDGPTGVLHRLRRRSSKGVTGVVDRTFARACWLRAQKKSVHPRVPPAPRCGEREGREGSAAGSGGSVVEVEVLERRVAAVFGQADGG